MDLGHTGRKGNGETSDPCVRVAPRPEDVAAATLLLRGTGNPRRTFCLAAARLLRAEVATLWEVRGDGLEPTATSGEELPLVTGLMGSAAGRAAVGGVRFFAGDTWTDPGADRQFVERLGLRSVVAEPIRIGDRATGAITIGWCRPVEELDPLVSGFLSLMAVQASMAIDRADLAARLEQQALTDPLTDLPNRRGLARELDREMARATRTDSPLGFALMDLDNFKAYNDHHGHVAGDRLLVRAARAWRRNLRAQDTLARYGGEEFVILLPDCGVDALVTLEVIERVRAATPGGQTVSVGLAIWDGREPAHELAARADGALYAAKGEGRDRAIAVW
ncbi:MAG: diguanylate cyclase/phosphodiesterase (GGDEF & EAL domains) with PAS/PAC sensor(s) [uncultured Solirubrobacteraceae bacterium]|uniref:Diguanylate cyclase/phosphodiesterase (GGDEF & EAL domains) with PAS/PAC sensor(S) n=1 Tax=uncultured Solirubrobacteraceae bacterium TaxID=1162706 RepID=A0A6J4SUE7_9ACTN|nr:MAG: diguanylate cyclase/phosphodiesterase (GGDEF & EAL domains) with PAS/PAC sensor(s) [uncultured Solirubrobacteraceae bacterium]